MSVIEHEWDVACSVWNLFLAEHPELGYSPGHWGWHNFLRRYKERLVLADAIRMAKRKFWIAHRSRFLAAAFDCATGHSPALCEG